MLDGVAKLQFELLKAFGSIHRQAILVGDLGCSG
jgi:hypothetical protein